MERKLSPRIGFFGIILMIIGVWASWCLVFIAGTIILVYALFVGHVKVFG